MLLLGLRGGVAAGRKKNGDDDGNKGSTAQPLASSFVSRRFWEELLRKWLLSSEIQYWSNTTMHPCMHVVTICRILSYFPTALLNFPVSTMIYEPFVKIFCFMVSTYRCLPQSYFPKLHTHPGDRLVAAISIRTEKRPVGMSSRILDPARSRICQDEGCG